MNLKILILKLFDNISLINKKSQQKQNLLKYQENSRLAQLEQALKYNDRSGICQLDYYI